uniref:Ig-like domain-containing protein n=1 Tax=Callorhinchus milii TaxID=7868 RepID=A0A4W3HCA7_CALMI
CIFVGERGGQLQGHPARLQCSMENADVSHTDVHWYRQLPGQHKEWILTHDTNGRKTDHEDVNQRLQPSRVTSNNTYILTLRRVTVSDAAVYHCCVWGDVCGNGTRLNVTSE